MFMEEEILANNLRVLIICYKHVEYFSDVLNTKNAIGRQ